ncbi:MAG: hypothetical protein Q8P79_03525 [Nanoarchaeota archaeon]|nr:hypothetical protein [Nanoarchaeota archaeon]
MGKNLISRFKNRIYAGLTAALSLGCPDGPTPPIEPKISQTAQLQNFIDIGYTARLENVSQAARKTIYNGNLTDTKMISTPSYSETLGGRLKGSYMFVLEADGLKPDTTRIEIPNYMPTADLSGLQTNMNKTDTLRINLENRLNDDNMEDRPVPIINAASTDGKTQVSLNGYELEIISREDGGQYEVKIDYGSNTGGLAQNFIRGQIKPDQIAFWSNRPVPEGGYNEEIYLMNEDGTGVQRLTTHPGQDLEPAWSPDGKELLFTSHRTGGTAVWRMNADGSNQRDIISAIVERARQADWCSNGKIVVAYRNLGDSEAGIGIINPDENTFTPIYSQPNAGGIPEWPSWSPDCSEIAFARYLGNWDVWKMNSDGSGLTNLTNHSAVDGQPSWSQNGSRIVFMSDREGTLSLYELNLNNNDIRNLTDNQGTEVDPSYSQDGTKIIFAHDIVSFFNPQVYMINSDGTGEWTQLTSQGANRYPAWRPR